MQAGMIENMLDGDPLQRGDGAFSMYALDTLIAHHLAEIRPVDDDLYAQLAADRVFGSVISTYAFQSRPSQPSMIYLLLQIRVPH